MRFLITSDVEVDSRFKGTLGVAYIQLLAILDTFEICGERADYDVFVADLLLKVTVDLQGCLPKNHSHARRLCYTVEPRLSGLVGTTRNSPDNRGSG